MSLIFFLLKSLATPPLCEKCPDTKFFLVRISLYSVRIQENTGQKKLRIWTLSTQCTWWVRRVDEPMKISIRKTTQGNNNTMNTSIFYSYIFKNLLWNFFYFLITLGPQFLNAFQGKHKG